MSSSPEPVTLTGGPFDVKVHKERSGVTIVVSRNKTLLTSITLPKARAAELAHAILEVA
jgi:hypothetical protein